MRSVMGASRALEELACLMPSDAHKLMPGGEIRDVIVAINALLLRLQRVPSS
jgi:Cu2+-exporting ATPase